MLDIVSPIILSTEKIGENLAEDENINLQLANKYESKEGEDRREPFRLRIEDGMVETIKREIEHVAVIDTELKRLGIETQNTISTEPQEFLEFVFQNYELVGLSKGTLEREKYKVDDDLTISYNEGDAGETPFYVIVPGEGTTLCSFLLQKGIDVINTDANKLHKLIGGSAMEAFKELTKTVYEGQEDIRKIIYEERQTYAKDLQQDFAHAIQRLKTEESADDAILNFQQIFEFYRYIPERSKNENSLIPKFEELIQAKGTLPPETTKKVNTFFETNEELIFKALGEDYFFQILDKKDSFEDAYREMFGYKVKDIWERRDRNWKEVNEYMTEEIANRGYITVEDLRQVHVLSTKGVLPFFSQGLRSDRNIGWYTSDHYKKTVVIHAKGSEVSTTDAEKLEESLGTLVNKANKLVSAKYPQIIAEVSLGNLFAEYATIHPHPDGNGTNAVFFIEALQTLRGSHTPPETYDKNCISRLSNALNHNPVALAVAATRIRSYELTHKITSQEK